MPLDGGRSWFSEFDLAEANVSNFVVIPVPAIFCPYRTAKQKTWPNIQLFLASLTPQPPISTLGCSLITMRFFYHTLFIIKSEEFNELVLWQSFNLSTGQNSHTIGNLFWKYLQWKSVIEYIINEEYTLVFNLFSLVINLVIQKLYKAASDNSTNMNQYLWNNVGLVNGTKYN